jgi:hypothetical protein
LALAGNEAVPRSLAASDFRGTAPVLILPDLFNNGARPQLASVSKKESWRT